MTDPNTLATRLHSLGTRVGRRRLDDDEMAQLDELVSLFNNWSRRRRVQLTGDDSDAAHMRRLRARSRRTSTDHQATDHDIADCDGDGEGTRNLPAVAVASAYENDARTREVGGRA